VVGDREVDAREVAVRDRKGQDLGSFDLDRLIARLAAEVATRAN
jgi:threonyl-tRNA synthetase